MANYDILTYSTGRKDNAGAANNALEAKLDAIDDSKTLHLVKLVKVGVTWEGIIIYNA